jgi:hypothetical protein
VISAGVITANIIWKATNAMPGMFPSSVGTFDNQANSVLPMRAPVPPNASENPIIAHNSEMMLMAKMFCMSMPSTFLARTMPP